MLATATQELPCEAPGADDPVRKNYFLNLVHRVLLPCSEYQESLAQLQRDPHRDNDDERRREQDHFWAVLRRPLEQCPI